MAQNLGLSAKIEPTADRSSTRKMKRDLERELQDVEQLEFQGSGGDFQSRTMPTGSMSGRRGGGGGFGGAGMGFAARGAMSRGAAGGAATSASRGLAGLGGGAALAGAGVAMTVALGGVMASKMYDAMSRASGTLQAANSIWGQAFNLFWKPFGDALGKTLLPYAEEALSMATTFNKIADKRGLTVAIGWLAGNVQDKLTPDLSGFDLPTPQDAFKSLRNFQWSDYVDALSWMTYLNPMTWGQWIAKLAWDSWVSFLDWGNFMSMLSWGAWISGNLQWSRYISAMSSDEIGEMVFGAVKVTANDVLDWIFSDFSIDKSDVLDVLLGDDDGGGGGGGSGGGGGGDGRAGAPRDAPTEHGSGHAPDLPSYDEIRDSVQHVTVENKMEVDGKRLYDGVAQERDGLMRRL